MTTSFQLELLSPSKPLANMAVHSVLAPGAQGYLCVMPHHAQMVCALKSGILTLEAKDKKLKYFVSGGYLEVLEDRVIVLVDGAEAPSQVDLARAKEAEKRALERLEKTSDLDLDIPRALASLERARARQRLSAD